MATTFKQFLADDINVSIDPNAGSAEQNAAVRRAAQSANRSPADYAKDQLQQANADRLAAQADRDDPNARLKARIAQAKSVLARLQQQLAQSTRSQPKTGVTT
jgi:hypothetical protein